MPPESSPEIEVNANAETETNQDVNISAESSPAEAGVETLTPLQVVEAALKGEKAESPAAETGKEKATPEPEKSGDEADGESDDKSDPTEEEIKSYPPTSQRRIHQLLDQRDDARRQAESLKSRAEQWDRLAGFIRENDITPQEVDNALEITRLINGRDYDKALQILTPIYQELASKAGELLPEDLIEEVRLGRITEQRARELNRARANAEALQSREKRNQERSQVVEENKRVQARIDTAVKSVDEWAKVKAGSDPDWHLKQDEVAEQVELELSRRFREKGVDGYPKTEQEAVEIADKALKKVEARLAKLKPKPAERRTPTGQFASPHSKPEPTSHLDAVRQAVGG